MTYDPLPCLCDDTGPDGICLVCGSIPDDRLEEDDRSHKRELLLAAAGAARVQAELAGNGIHGSFHLSAAERLEDTAKSIELIGAPSDEDERAWVMYRIARAYLNVPLVST